MPALSHRAARRRSALVTLAAVLTLAACSPASDSPPGGTAAPRSPGQETSPEASPDPSATPGTDPSVDTDAPVRWDLPDAPGYVLSPTQPLPTVLQLDNAELGCAYQASYEVIPDEGITDSEYTDAALVNAVAAIGTASTETGRRDGVIPTSAGPLEAREIALVLETSGVEVEMRMLMRASGRDGVLVALVQVCPGGLLDEATWEGLVAGTTLSGTTATDF